MAMCGGYRSRRSATASSQSDLKNPDFVKLADAFGLMGLRATTPEGLRAALKKALAAGEPALIEVPVGQMPSPWNFLRFQHRVRGG